MDNKPIVIFLLLFIIAVISSAQIYDPVAWDFRYEKKDSNRYDLVFIASIEEVLIFILWIFLKTDLFLLRSVLTQFPIINLKEKHLRY